MFNTHIDRMRALASLNAFTFSGAQGLIVTLYPFFAERLGLSIASVIGSFAFGSFLFLFGSPFWSARSDRWSRQSVLTLGTIALFLSFGTLVLLSQRHSLAPATGLCVLVLSRALYGLVASSIAPVAQALQADLSSPGQSSRAMFLHSVSLSLGRVVSLGAFVLLGARVQSMLHLVWVWIALVVIVNFFALFSAPVSSRETDGTSISDSSPSRLNWVMVIAFLFTCFIESLNSSLTGNLKSIFQMSSQDAAQLGAKILLACGLAILLIQLARAFVQRFSWKAAMSAGVSSLLLGSAGLAIARSHIHLWISFAFLSIGTGLIPPLYLSLLGAARNSKSYGRQAGLVGSAQTLGYAAGAGVAAFSFHHGIDRIGPVLFGIAGLIALACARQSSMGART